MNYWLVLWIGIQCPGGWFSGLIPGQVKPLICSQQPAFKYTPFRREADRSVLENAGARLFWCKNLMCHEIKIERRLETYIGGRKI